MLHNIISSAAKHTQRIMATRWACVGAGKISSDFFTAVQQNLPASEHELVAVAARDISRAQEFADKFKFKRAFSSYDDVAQDKEVEVVYIGTLHTSHVELSLKMLEAGKHVLCEKPMAMNYTQAKQVLDLAKAKNKLFVEAAWSRWFPVYTQVRKELEAGTLGEVKQVQATFCIPISNVPRIKEKALGGGGALDIGVYPVQFACFVFKEMPASITVVGNLLDTGVDENACVVLKYKSGAMANLTYHTSCKARNQASVIGTKGRIDIPEPFWCPTKVTTPTGSYDFPLKDGDYNFDNSAGLQYEAAAVRDYLLKGKIESEICSHDDSEMIHKILTEIRRQLGVVFPDFD